MMPAGRPLFEVIVAASADERRLVPVDLIRSMTGFTEAQIDDTALGLLIDAALATMARSCMLATWRASPPTLAQEAVRATWNEAYWRWWQYYNPGCAWPATLLLPWRAPITEIAITVDDLELDETEFRLLGSGAVELLDSLWPTSGNIVVDYTAGFVAIEDDASYQPDGATLPADLVMLIADQVRMLKTRGSQDLNLRSEDIPGVWSGTYNLAGGDTIDRSGLINTLYDALSPYRAPPAFA